MFSDAKFVPANVMVTGGQFESVTFNAIFITDEYKTLAIDLNTHKVIWSYEATGILALSSDGILYILDNISRQLTAIKFAIS